MTRPNVLYLHSHDTGRYIQPYGYPVPTPHLARLAGQGVLFRQAFLREPHLLGQPGGAADGPVRHSSGMLGLAHRGWTLRDVKQHIIHTLRPAGYRSTLIGTQHVAADASQIGYDEVVPGVRSREDRVAAAKAFFERPPQEPFFLSVGFVETHREYPPPGPAQDERWCRPPAPLPDTPQTRRDMAAFTASGRLLDDAMGGVIDALDSSGLADRTLVICTTDHGIAFPAMKCNLTDHGIGVMLILRGPGGLSGGAVCDAMVSHVDLFPTICELAGIDEPSWLQGRSLLPLVLGKVKRIHDELFAEVTYHAACEPMRAVRTIRYKYIRRFDPRGRPNLPNCDDSPSKDLWLEAGWRERPVPQEQLFDLVFDPNEACNVAGDPALGDVLSYLGARLALWMHATDDPLLRGPVPPPRGAKLNDPDGLSPNEPAQTVD